MTDSMARSQATESRKTFARQAFDGMVIRICPVTGGRPTRMLRASFKEMCRQHLERAREKEGGGGRKVTWCLECGGRKPSELEYLTKTELKELEGNEMGRSWKGKCALCGRDRQLKKNHGREVCSSCAGVQAMISNYPDVIAAEYRRLAGKSLDGGGDGDASPARQDDVMLASILEAMEGESVVDAAKRMKDVVVSLQNDMAVIAAAVGCKMDGVVAEVQRIVHQFATVGTASGLAKDIRQALNVTDDVVADELPGMITDLMRERWQYAAELDGVRKALEGAVDDDLVEVATSMVNELREARSIEYVLEEKSAPADLVSVSRLLSDPDLLASINTLSDALRS